MQLVERGPAAEAQLFSQEFVDKYLDQGTADQEVLFDLTVFRPRSGAAPGDDVHGGDHSSSSGWRRTSTFQRVLRSAGSLDFAGGPPGSNSTQGNGLAFCKYAWRPSAALGCLR